MPFRITTILWFVVVVVAAFVTFGPGGALVAAAVIAIWSLIFIFEPSTRRQRVHRLVGVVFSLLAVTFLVLMLLAMDFGMREAARRSQCLSQMKQLVLAMHEYHDAHNEFPPGDVRLQMQQC